jgi:hypothetical protein
MDTVNANKRWKTENHEVTRLNNERASFLKINDINDLSFFGTSAVIVVL